MTRVLAPPFPEHLVGWSVAEVLAAEQPLLAAGEPLMQRAADGLAEVVREQLASTASGPRSAGPAPRVLALVGAGNNGGDALWACARVAADDVPVAVQATATSIHEAGRDAAVAAGARLIEAAQLDDALATAEVVVDGILGIGSAGRAALRGAARDAVLQVRAHPRFGELSVVACDQPSGVDADSGDVPDPDAVLPATVTVTFGAVKRGLRRPPAREICGELRLVDIGLTRPV
ncbi:hydroxyethylthiazole kinase-like uncharacterized protein yjeF [Microcella alkaliphila]|uniref:NAD(P)H-hydrate epimerase n=1 Tax=Microcella alkaliphila TaxID=279828 RepID=A0A4Q7TTP6_9MICO|nr:NAD(P)H-hydrate epimerase [Microcella alkaliphila]RZT64356.1 hydroxyethylthiazole kinase-like uncharacterized protein yjeF [Microcella alkaliphila]